MNTIDTVSRQLVALTQSEQPQTTGGETLRLINIIRPLLPTPRIPFFPPHTTGGIDPDGIYPFPG